MARLRQWLRCALPGLVLLGVGMATAGAAPYSEPLERSDWQLTEEDAACRIQQTVRHGGTLRFAYWCRPSAPAHTGSTFRPWRWDCW